MPSGQTTYSFLDVQATIVGPNGVAVLGNGSGAADEGISIQYAEDQGTITTGADGSWMPTVHAAQSGTVIVRMLKSSPTNSILQAMYSADRAVPSSGGQNTIVVTWLTAGDVFTAQGCIFKKFPDETYGKDGPLLEWAWGAGYITPLLGSGT
jgi:Protein of unknown function (DUF3277)